MCAKFKVGIYSAELETRVKAGNWGGLNIYIPVIQHVGSSYNHGLRSISFVRNIERKQVQGQARVHPSIFDNFFGYAAFSLLHVNFL